MHWLLQRQPEEEGEHLYLKLLLLLYYRIDPVPGAQRWLSDSTYICLPAITVTRPQTTGKK